MEAQQPTFADLTTKALPGSAVEDPPFDIIRLKRMFDESRTNLSDSRIDSEISRDYYDGPKQLSPAMRAVLRERMQPEIYENHIRGAVDGVVGVIDSNKVDPRAYPREPSDEDAADVASDTLRYTAQQNHFNVIKADCLENGIIEGCYACIIEGGPDQDVTVTQVRWDEFFYDARSRQPNFHDARYLGIGKWMYSDQVFQIFKEALAKLGITDETMLPLTSDASGISPGGSDVTWEDKPEDVISCWIDGARRRLMIVEVYHQDKGAWYRSVFCAAGILEHGLSPYTDDRGVPRCAIIAGSCFVSRENRRYGIVADMRPIQDEINMRRSKLLHELNVRQVQQTDLNSPPVDVNTVRHEAARPDGVIPPGWTVVNRRDIVEGQAQLLAESKAELDRMGPNLALQGRDAASASGRQDQIRQDAGIRQLQRVLGRFADWELRCYKAMWAVQRQFWTAPKWIRVTGDDMSPKYIQINETVAPGVPKIDPQTGQPAVDAQGRPVWQTPPQVKNHVAEMDVDIIIDTVPDTASLQQEVWQELVRLIAASPSYAQQVPFKLAIEMSPLPRKRELLDMLDAAAQATAGKQQAAETLAANKAMSEQVKTESEAVKNFATAKNLQIEGIASAVAAHIDISSAEMIEEQYMNGIPGIPGIPGVTPTASDQAPPAPPQQNSPTPQ